MYTGFSRVIYSTPHGSVILVSLETRLVSYETRLVSRETRGGKLRVSGTVRYFINRLLNSSNATVLLLRSMALRYGKLD